MEKRGECTDAPPGVFRQCVAAGKNQGVEPAKPVLDGPRSTPELRRAPPFEAAGDARRSIARFAVVFPEKVHRTDEPMLVCGHDSHGFVIGTQAEDAGASNQ